MKLTFYKSAGVLIESGGSRLLCDPWLQDGAYYGAWAHVPPCDVTAEEIGPVDGIYISHIHPDHLHASTLATFDKRTPVYIHQYAFPYLRDAIAALGFANVAEVENGQPAMFSTMDGWLSLTIYAADNCDPTLCGQFFGCDAKVGADRPGSVQIDSMAVISDGKHTIVNVNDCPFALAAPAIQSIKERFGKPDLLLVNYVGAGPYPQCYTSLSEFERLEAGEKKREQFLKQAEDYIKALEPKAFFPFAGTYTLAGYLTEKNRFRGVCSQAEAGLELGKRCPGSRPLYLPTRGSYEVGAEPASVLHDEWPPDRREAYERDVLAPRKLDFEGDDALEPWQLISLLKIAGERFRKRCEDVGLYTDTRVYVSVDNYNVYRLPMRAMHGRTMRLAEARTSGPHLIMRTDSRLLRRLLAGEAHWQDATVGSLIDFERQPDRYERGLEFCLNDLHV